MDGWMFFEFLFVSFFSCSFLSSVFFFVCQTSSIRARKNTRPEKRNRTPHLDRERERIERDKNGDSVGENEQDQEETQRVHALSIRYREESFGTSLF